MTDKEADEITASKQVSQHSTTTGKLYMPSHKFGIAGRFANGGEFSDSRTHKDNAISVAVSSSRNLPGSSIVVFSRKQGAFKTVWHN